MDAVFGIYVVVNCCLNYLLFVFFFVGGSVCLLFPLSDCSVVLYMRWGVRLLCTRLPAHFSAVHSVVCCQQWPKLLCFFDNKISTEEGVERLYHV